MSTIKMQESIPDDEVTILRKQVTHKDNRYATLENELLKKNNDLLAMKGTLNETLYKLRNEADRALKLESDLNRRAEDLRAERLTRQNLEASLKAASEKLNSEEQTSKHLQMELENYASRTSSQHELEIKRLQHEKMTLESRVRAMEGQILVKPSQLPTRLPRPTTFSGASSTVTDARIASLECDLSKAERELTDVSRSLSTARQEAAKVPRIQAELIAAENARMRAEKLAKTEKEGLESVREMLKEQEEELEYLRSVAGERSLNEGRLEEAIRERDEAVKMEEEIRIREVAMRKRMEEMELKEAELVMEREEALNELHRLQAQSSSNHDSEHGPTLAELRVTVAEREAALQNARGYAVELQQMYRDTLKTCEDAEARVQDLERQLQPPQDDPLPLVIISPPPSPAASKPFLVQPKPMSMMSAEDEAIVTRLLSAIERLRSERDALRRDLHFADVEHRVAEDVVSARVKFLESEIHRLEEAATVSKDSVDEASTEAANETLELKDDLERWRRKFEDLAAESASRTAEMQSKDVEMEMMHARIRDATRSNEGLLASHKESCRIAVSSLVMVQHFQSGLDKSDASRVKLAEAYEELMLSRDELARTCDGLAHSHNEIVESHAQVTGRLADVIQARDKAILSQEMLLAEGATADTRLADATKEVEERDIQIADMHSKVTELQNHISSLQYELSEVREELSAAEARHSTQQLSTLPCMDNGSVEDLKPQLEVLEQRVLRRTEQIGMLQHDTKRLETNLRVAEDTIGELTTELDTLAQERACLVEDCAQAREARDLAHRKIEDLEVEVETLMKGHEELKEVRVLLLEAQAEVATSVPRIEAMVRVVAESAAKSRALSTALTHTTTRLATAKANLNSTETRHSNALKEVERLTSEFESMTIAFHSKMDDISSLSKELSLAEDKTQRLNVAFECFKSEVESREQDVSTTVIDLEDQLLAARGSEDALSQELEAARKSEKVLQAQLEQMQQESIEVTIKVQSLSSAVTTLEQTLELEQSSHCETLTQAHKDFMSEISILKTQAEEVRKQHASLQAEHTHVVQDFTAKLEEARSRLTEANAIAITHQSLEHDFRRLESEHADELLVLRSRLDESIGQTDSIQGQLQTATEAIASLESEIGVSVERYDAAQVEICGLEQALAGARAQLDEHDASIHALHREKTTLQIEHTRLEAELDKVTTKYQYVEQQAKRSDYNVLGLKSEVEHLRCEVAKFDEAAQAAEINLSFKANQFEQKLAALQRELQKQQSHRQCQESIAGLNEKNEYLEEMLRMRSVEIEENDDRFIDILKEKKRLSSKVESLTRKVQSLQTKLEIATTNSGQSAAATPLVAPPPKTPSPPMPISMPSAGTSTRTRIPSSPAVALRAKTPEALRRAAVSRLTTPEHPVPPFPLMRERVAAPRPESRVDLHRPLEIIPSTLHTPPPDAPSTPLSSGCRKRRAPDDFDSPMPLPAQAVVAPRISTTPRHPLRPTNEVRSGFTPTRNGVAAPLRPAARQPSPLRRNTGPLAESTNSPRGNLSIGLGKPVSVSKPPVRSWLIKARAPTSVGGDSRSTSVLGVRP